MRKSACRGLGPCQMFRNCALIIFEFMILEFEEFLPILQNTTIKLSTTEHFANFGAPGVLKTAPACIFIIFYIVKLGVQCMFNSFCIYLIIVCNSQFLFGSVVLTICQYTYICKYELIHMYLHKYNTYTYEYI